MSSQSVRLDDPTSLQWTSRLWRDVPIEAIKEDPNMGTFFEYRGAPYNSGDWTWQDAASTSQVVSQISLNGGATQWDPAAGTAHLGGVLQLGGAGTFQPSASRTIVAEIVMRFTTWTTAPKVFFGLATFGQVLGTTSLISSVTDYVGFYSGSTTTVNFNSKNASVATSANTATEATLVSGTWVKWGFRIKGLSDITPYVRGVRSTTSVITSVASSPIPTGVMALSFGHTAQGQQTLGAVKQVRIASFEDNTAFVT